MNSKLTTNKSTQSRRRQTSSDSGTQVNIIPENQIETLQKKPRITISMATLSNIPIIGQSTLDIQHHGKNFPLLFILADTNFLLVIGANCRR